MKIYIEKDERYPDYFISSFTDGKEVEVPDDLVARYEEAKNLYEAIQDELEDLYKGN